jgi:hypothetical protein
MWGHDGQDYPFRKKENKVSEVDQVKKEIIERFIEDLRQVREIQTNNRFNEAYEMEDTIQRLAFNYSQLADVKTTPAQNFYKDCLNWLNHIHDSIISRKSQVKCCREECMKAIRVFQKELDQLKTKE